MSEAREKMLAEAGGEGVRLLRAVCVDKYKAALAEIESLRTAVEEAERERDTLLEALDLASPAPWRAPDKSAEFLAEHGDGTAYTEASDARGNDIGDFHYHGEEASRVVTLAERVNAISAEPRSRGYPGQWREEWLLVVMWTMRLAGMEPKNPTALAARPTPPAPEGLFPVLYHRLDDLPPGLPTHVPWSLVEPYERQAMRNHGGQSLERLAERGGLSPLEIYLLVHDRSLRWPRKADEKTAIAWLQGLSEKAATSSPHAKALADVERKRVDLLLAVEQLLGLRLPHAATDHAHALAMIRSADGALREREQACDEILKTAGEQLRRESCGPLTDEERERFLADYEGPIDDRVGGHVICGATGKCVDCGATREHATAFQRCGGGDHGE